jgi:anti-sigma factor RsiW
VSLAIDGEIDAMSERQLHRHLRSCPECLAIASEYEQIARMLRSSERERPQRPVALPRRLPSRLRVRASLVVAAAVIAVVAVGGLSGSSGRSGSITPTAVFLGASFPTSYDPSRPVLIEHRA